MNEAAQKNTPFKVEELPQTSTILVAGCASAIGSYLCEELLALGCRVYGVDNLLTGKKENLQEIINHKNFIFLNKDLNSKDFIVNQKIDYIFHLAGVEEYLGKTDLTLETLLVNSLGTTKLLDLARTNNAKFEFVSTIDIVWGALSNKSLDGNLGQSQTKARTYSHHEAKRYAEVLVTEYYKKFHINARIIRLIDVYGPRMNLEAGGYLNKLFKHVFTDKILTIEGDGLYPLYPIYIKDVVSGLIRSMFGHETSGHIYHLVENNKTTLLSFAHELKKYLSEETRIVFVQEEKDKIPPPDHNWIIAPKNLGWKIKVGFEEGINKTLLFFNNNLPKKQNEQNPNRVDAVSTPIFRPQASDKQNNFWYRKKPVVISMVVVFLLFIVLLPFFISLFFVFNIKRDLSALEKDFKTQNFDKLKTTANNLKNNFNSTESYFKVYKPAFRILGNLKTYENTVKVFNIGENAAEAVSHLAGGAKYLDEAAKIILIPEKEGALGISLGLARQELSLADDQLAYIQTQLTQIDIKNIFFIKIKSSQFLGYVEQFKKTRSYLSKIRDFSAVLPNTVAINGKKTYLLLFANNMEIRPSGGFLGSYGFLSFDSGKMGELSVDDVYNADGQLTGHVEPPGPIRKYLGQPHWYLRDSNWSPDFLETSRQAEWFLEKETGRKVDGVLMVDLSVVKKILDIIGPVNLPDYQETINSANLFEKANYYSQTDFFPGSTQKKDFLSTLSRKIIEKLLSSWHNHSLQLLLAINSQLEEKHLVLNFHDEASQNIISRFNWGGRLAGDVCEGRNNCLGDYFMAVDANLSVNKANLFVTRKISHKILIDENLQIKEKVSIVYENNSTKETKIEGTYRNYLRVYLPSGSNLVNLTKDEQDLPFILSSLDLKNSQNKLIVDKTEEMGKTVYGLLIEVPPGGKQTIALSYDLDFPLEIENDMLYKLVLQKQIGSGSDNYDAELILPDFIKAKEASLPIKIDKSSVKFQTTNEKDKVVIIRLSK